MNAEKNVIRVHDTGTEKTGAGMSGTRPRKPYNAPQVIEHGSVEDITGFTLDGCIGSGCPTG